MWTHDLPPIDALAAAARLRRLPGLAFLDSAMRHPELGRCSIVAADPFARFRFRDGRASLDGRPVPGGPMEALRACLAPYRMEPDPAVPGPFPYGAIGCLAYDLGAYLEHAGLTVASSSPERFAKQVRAAMRALAGAAVARACGVAQEQVA